MSAQELAATAAAMVARGRGILAIDESHPSIKKRFDSINIESSEENRRAYRELLINNPGDAAYISGMILFDETIRQQTASGTPFPKVLAVKGIMTGIKVDTGAKDLVGFSGEQVTEGLDGLRARLTGYKALDAKFSKWCAAITIGSGIPTLGCIEANAHALARSRSKRNWWPERRATHLTRRQPGQRFAIFGRGLFQNSGGQSQRWRLLVPIQGLEIARQSLSVLGAR